jgi:hypothetical protein
VSNPFQKATKIQAKLRMALIGASGSGKTYTALKIASVFGKVALIDTEHGSASKYADLFTFDVLELTNFDPRSYISAMEAAAENGYDAVVIDSLSHSWKELLNQKNQLDTRGGNSYVNWGKITPKQDALIEAILASPLHVIGTMRAKMDHVMETDDKGRIIIRKVGLAPIQRDDVEYEFDVVADMDNQNTMMVSKSRCPALSGVVIAKPDEKVAAMLKAWLSDGSPVVDKTTGEIVGVGVVTDVATFGESMKQLHEQTKSDNKPTSDELFNALKSGSEPIIHQLDATSYTPKDVQSGLTTVPDTSFLHKLNIGKVKARVQSFYLEDGRLNTFHMHGSICKLLNAGALNIDMNNDQAYAVIEKHHLDAARQEADLPPTGTDGKDAPF